VDATGILSITDTRRATANDFKNFEQTSATAGRIAAIDRYHRR
jgi:hypothetical protein